MNKFTALVHLLLRPRKLQVALGLSYKGYFAGRGWFEAYEKKQSIGKNNEPLPWVTYSFIDFIQDRISDKHHIFEYGSGNSTLFYAERAATVISVEHDKGWFDSIRTTSPANAELLFCELDKDGEYARKAVALNKKFDLVIVDGRDRVNCCKYGMHALTENGVLILDDSDRKNYHPARVLLKENGFRELSFSGVAPGVSTEKTTSVFYKTDNCLGI